jgi:hypothetical protein
MYDICIYTQAADSTADATVTNDEKETSQDKPDANGDSTARYVHLVYTYACTCASQRLNYC